jgi:hypothetical protein
MNRATLKKLSRKKTGAYGRPGTKYLKRQASKAARRVNKQVDNG